MLVTFVFNLIAVLLGHFLYAGRLTEHRQSQEQATLKDDEKAAMSYFRRATKRAAVQQKLLEGTKASTVDKKLK